jgi:hypothetical protein
MRFVKSGEFVRSSDINDLVTHSRKRTSKPKVFNPPVRMVYNPFDVISREYDGTDWLFKLQPSWIISDNETSSIQVQNTDNDWTNLDDYPSFKVIKGPEKHLYLNKTSARLTWETFPQPDKLLILQSVALSGAEDLYSYTNKFPSVVYGSGITTECAFGSVTGGLSGSYIKGGIIHCGDKNFTVPNYEIDLGDNGRKLLYFEIECESNRDDDNEIFLPAVKTSAWEPAWEDTSDDEYPDNTHPVLATGLGTIIVPVGELIIASGSLSAFNATGCDNITISQCAGTLSYSRG